MIRRLRWCYWFLLDWRRNGVRRRISRYGLWPNLWYEWRKSGRL